MLGRKNIGAASLRLLLSALLVWLYWAAGLLLFSTLILSRVRTGSAMLGYISSAISFLCAAAAGAYASKRRESKNLTQTAILSGVLTLLLLTIGFLVRGRNMNASGILSVVSFTLTGCLIGGLFFGRKSARAGKRHGFGRRESRRKFT